jgi:hypothetical protein
MAVDRLMWLFFFASEIFIRHTTIHRLYCLSSGFGYAIFLQTAPWIISYLRASVPGIGTLNTPTGKQTERLFHRLMYYHYGLRIVWRVSGPIKLPAITSTKFFEQSETIEYTFAETDSDF